MSGIPNSQPPTTSEGPNTRLADPLDGLLDEVVTTREEEVARPVAFSFITGPAGSGKTWQVKQKSLSDPSWRLCATTGIAAVNLDTVTINSTLKYFDTQSLMDNHIRGRLVRRLREMADEEGLRMLCIDEISMMPAEQLEIIYEALQQANAYLAGKEISLTLTGDFAQLPPISSKSEPARFVFEASCWPPSDIQRLTKIWRQSDPTFLEALRLARLGQGPGAVEALREAGVKFAPAITRDFPGATIYSKNDEVDKYNALRFQALPGNAIELRHSFRGKPAGEWLTQIPGCPGGKIPPLKLKPQALVMILANDIPDFRYANGDLATILEAGPDAIHARIHRTNQEVGIERIRRYHLGEKDDEGAVWVQDLRGGEGAWVLGSVDWFPLRLGYASTVHKTQGLTLDNVQVDCRDWFFGMPNMAYVALSRSRTPGGLTIVGPSATLARQIKLHPQVKEWI